MADHGGGVPAASQGNANGAAPRTRTTTGEGVTAPNTAVFRSPKDVWKDRKARMDQAESERKERENREKADMERLQAAGRKRAEEEARLIEEATRGRHPSGGSASTERHHTQEPPPARPRQTSQTQTQAQAQHQHQHQHQQRPLDPAPQLTSRKPTAAQEILARAGLSQSHDGAPPPEAATAGTAGTQRQQQQQQQQQVRTSFPHAFERWETLSAHWEGLTNYWIRKLEANKEAIENDPLSQQLSRQVTDLSAAGANLFHAVVELQRLRASSERKFTRWFFETRSELERCQEQVATLEHALKDAQSGRVDAIHKQNDLESQANRHLAELRKELSISKDEARRAWEELGRREQEERERTSSLQSGKPTVVGGVQVVPMTMGVPSRHNSSGGRDHHQHHQRYTDYDDRSAYQPEYTQAPPVQSTPTAATTQAHSQPQSQSQSQSAYYAPMPPTLHEALSYGDLSEEEGYSDEDFETPATHAAASYPPTPSGMTSAAGPAHWGVPAGAGYPEQQQQQQQPQAQPQYNRQEQQPPPQQATGPPLSWDAVPRHHHPTRLSDVMEEDERSRTSASQLSRGG